LRINHHYASTEEASKKLKEPSSGMPNVKVAVPSSSALREPSARGLDVGVSMDPEPDLKRAAETSSALEDALGAPIDITSLSWAPSKLRLRALSSDVKLIVRGSRLYAPPLSEAYLKPWTSS